MQSPDSLRCHSVQLTTPPEARQINFGDDQNINYSTEKIKLNTGVKKLNAGEGKDQLQVPEGSAGKGSRASQSSLSDDQTPIKLPLRGQNTSITEVDEATYGSPQFTSASKDHEIDHSGKKGLNSPEKGATTLDANVSLQKQEGKASVTAQDQEDDDPYGLGKKSQQPSNFNPKELELYKMSLMHNFQNEFKDSITTVENLPRGSIMLSAIKACLSDDNKLVKRGILDMINNLVK